MAVDTVSKRYSMLHLGEGIHILPHPDGTLHARDRLNLITLYSGIADAEGGGGGGGAVPSRSGLSGGLMRLSGGLL